MQVQVRRLLADHRGDNIFLATMTGNSTYTNSTWCEYPIYWNETGSTFRTATRIWTNESEVSTAIFYDNQEGWWTTSTPPWTAYYNSFVMQEACAPKRSPLIKKSVKQSIKRALKLMTNFGFEEDVRVFLGGGAIEVSHPESNLKFVLTKDRSILSGTEYPSIATPYKLSLYTKSGVHVADLCVYMDKTPVLDQVLALAAFIKTGNEESILKKANFRRLTDDVDQRIALAAAVPYLESKLLLPARL